MSRIGYPNLSEHQRRHIEMKDQLNFLLNQVASGNAGVIEKSTTLLNDWWNKHILIEDMAYKNFEAGES